ncbi:hypothetical protein CHU98_g9668 [Xylaria longipes]|nr:hypothetical protein CHU98_g9668 [Xylaria longipes]
MASSSHEVGICQPIKCLCGEVFLRKGTNITVTVHLPAVPSNVISTIYESFVDLAVLTAGSSYTKNLPGRRLIDLLQSQGDAEPMWTALVQSALDSCNAEPESRAGHVRLFLATKKNIVRQVESANRERTAVFLGRLLVAFHSLVQDLSIRFEDPEWTLRNPDHDIHKRPVDVFYNGSTYFFNMEKSYGPFAFYKAYAIVFRLYHDWLSVALKSEIIETSRCDVCRAMSPTHHILGGRQYGVTDLFEAEAVQCETMYLGSYYVELLRETTTWRNISPSDPSSSRVKPYPPDAPIMALIHLGGYPRTEICVPAACRGCNDIFLGSNRVMRSVALDLNNFYGNIIDIAVYTQILKDADSALTAALLAHDPYELLYHYVHSQPGVGGFMDQLVEVGKECYSSGTYSTQYIGLRDFITAMLPMTTARCGQVFLAKVLVAWDQACEEVEQFSVRWSAVHFGNENPHLRVLHRVRDGDDHSGDYHSLGSEYEQLDKHLIDANCEVACVYKHWSGRARHWWKLFGSCLRCAGTGEEVCAIANDIGNQVTLLDILERTGRW